MAAFGPNGELFRDKKAELLTTSRRGIALMSNILIQLIDKIE